MNWRGLLFFPAVAIGIGLYALQMRGGPDAATALSDPEPVAVRVHVVEQKPITVRFSGFGRVEPVRSWEAISQIDARVLYALEELAVGSVLPAGAEVMRADPRDYEINLSKAEANLASVRAQLDELEAQETNTAALLALEQEIEAFLRNDYERTRTLAERGTVSNAVLEQANRDLLNQQRQVLDLTNALNLYPVQRVSIESTIATREVELEEAQRDLDNTSIVLPFRGRIAEKNVSEGQYVRPGDRLFTLHGVDVAEIVAAVQPLDLGDALAILTPQEMRPDFVLGDDVLAIELLEHFDWTVSVRQTMGGRQYTWPATLNRYVASVDSETGTVGLVVRVTDPVHADASAPRPPLNNGAFVEVIFERRTDERVLAIPRSALRSDPDGSAHVFTVAPDETLTRQDIDLRSVTEAQAIVNDGVSVGDRVILSDPRPAILGMPVDIVRQEPL